MSALRWLLGGWQPGEGELALGSGGPWLALGLACAAALPVLAWWSARGVRWRLPQALLLLPVSAALAWGLAQPRWVQRGGWWEDGRFVVLLDDSASMGVREGGRPRGAAVDQALAAMGQPAAERIVFGGGIAVGAAPGYAQPDTDLAQALRSAAERYAGERLAGIALISDGLDRSALRAAWRAGEPLDPGALPGPLSVYGIGRPEALSDLGIRSVATGGFAFLRTPLELRVALSGSGYPGLRVPVTLTCDGAPLARQQVELDAQGQAELAFTVTPASVGRHVYRVQVPPQAGDAVPGNDELSVVVRVVRDRLRVLQVCGSPSQDQQFLRRFLKEDPAVDLVSFFILRTHEDMAAGYGDEELALIPFPYDRLFQEDLSSFDLVIFQNFDYQPYFGWEGETLLDNVAAWVRGGGAFAMIGGDRSFDLGAYAGTAIEEILPVKLGLDPAAAVDPAPFRPRLAEAGRRHPVTALAEGPVESAALWAALAPLDGLNLNQGPAPDAAVLLEHPSLRSPDGRPLPVLAVRSVGAGRSLALGADASWRWAFAEAGKGKGNQAYLRFWKQALRWLVGDPDAQQVSVGTARENHALGEPVRVVVRVRDAAFEPAAGVRLRGRLQPPALDALARLQAPGLDAEGRFELTSSADGEAVLELRGASAGAWKVAVEALDEQGRPFFSGSTVFAVTEREPELEELAPDLAFLEALAAAGGGTWNAPGAWGAPAVDRDARRRIEQSSVLPLGDAPLAILVAGLFLPLSWWLRRRGGGR